MIEFIVAQSDTELNPLTYLQLQVPAAPPAYLKQLLKKGRVTRNGEPLQTAGRLQVGDRIRLPESHRLRELLSTSEARQTPPQVLYESREILVIDKPAGLAVHSSLGHEDDNLTARVAALLAGRGQNFQVAPVHRLDLETSGPVLFGKGKQACGRLGQLFMQQQVDKFYLALVAGKTAGQGRLESSLPAKGKQKLARTDFRALVRTEQASLLELQLFTGRQHQIRRQLAGLGHPLYGDSRYRGPCPADLPRLFLHSFRLAFTDPFSGAPLEVEAPLPADLKTYLDLLGITA